MRRHDVRNLVFSSSCTVYGEPDTVPITEDTPIGATSPYGRTKLHIEEMLRDVAAMGGWHIALLRYVAKKGSICVDGVSLTVNAVDDEGFEVALIPHTVSHTAFSQTAVGDAVNLEIDLVARYVERLLGERSGA